MAAAFTHSHMLHGFGIGIGSPPATEQKTQTRGGVLSFLSDLLEDVSQKPLQAAEFTKHDMFREHINAMSISYFGLILALIAGSIFLMPALIPLLAGR